jgi:hypothetical protein
MNQWQKLAKIDGEIHAENAISFRKIARAMGGARCDGLSCSWRFWLLW